MAPSATPPIERRPMTTKQVRKQWQKKGQPTISSAEQRRLQREAQLEQRAQDIRDKDKRKKELKKKRDEKEAREKEKRTRMGTLQEEIKLPEGQLGLGAFFRAKTTTTKENDKVVEPEQAEEDKQDAAATGEVFENDDDGVLFFNNTMNDSLRKSGNVCKKNDESDAAVSLEHDFGSAGLAKVPQMTAFNKVQTSRQQVLDCASPASSQKLMQPPAVVFKRKLSDVDDLEISHSPSQQRASKRRALIEIDQNAPRFQLPQSAQGSPVEAQMSDSSRPAPPSGQALFSNKYPQTESFDAFGVNLQGSIPGGQSKSSGLVELSRSQLPAVFEKPAEQPKRPLFFANYHLHVQEKERKAAEAAKSAPVSRQLSPEVVVSLGRSYSAPSSVSKRKFDDARLEHNPSVESGSSHPVVRNKRLRTSPDALQAKDTVQSQQLESVEPEDIISKTKNPAASDFFGPSFDAADLADLGVAESLIHQGTENQLAKVDVVKATPPRRRKLEPVESFGCGLDDDDFLEAEESLWIVTPASNIAPNLQTTGSPALPTPRESNKEDAEQKKLEQELSSTQSFSCDFSSDDLAVLEAVTDTSPPPVLAVHGEKLPAVAQEDEFGSFGGTQDLAALADAVVPRAGKIECLTVEVKADEAKKTSMLPPPVPMMKQQTIRKVETNAPAVSPEEDDFGDFSGSTQALYDAAG